LIEFIDRVNRKGRGMTRVAIIQSNYIPWCGYFDIIAQCDIFIFLDDVQFTKNDWRNRNQIKTASGAQWLTIPCGKNISRNINQVMIETPKWAHTHWKTLVQNYAKTAFFNEYKVMFEELYLSWSEPVSLSEVNQSIIKMIAHEILKLGCQFHSSDEFVTVDHRVDRLVEIVAAVGGDAYLSGPAAKAYLDLSTFQDNNISVSFADYPYYGPYKQQHGDFIPNLSMIDALFNLGEESRDLFGCMPSVLSTSMA
jgi:hypothetical protein